MLLRRSLAAMLLRRSLSNRKKRSASLCAGNLRQLTAFLGSVAVPVSAAGTDVPVIAEAAAVAASTEAVWCTVVSGQYCRKED
jgi:hypothetical protein